MRKVGWVAVMRARQQLLCWRSAAVFILMGIFMFSYAQPFSDFARERGLEITPYAAVFIMDDIIAQLFLMLGAVALCWTNSTPIWLPGAAGVRLCWAISWPFWG